tara:strand:+ start:876 stop:1874 length:999 start_codon:yes stop_codon:yes gene_type:complete
MDSFLKRHWFLVGIAAAVSCGSLLPEGGQALRSSGYAIPLLVAVVLAISGFTLDTSRLLVQAKNLRAILLTLCTTYAMAPLLAYALARSWGPALDGAGSRGALFLEAMMILAAQAGTLASALAMTAIARGNQELALLITVLSSILTAILTPLVLELALGEIVDIPIVDIMLRMLLIVVLPVFVGQLARKALWERAEKAAGVVKVLPRVIILSFLYTGFSAATEHLHDAPALALRFLGACLCLHLALLLWTWLSSRLLGLTAESRTAVILCGSQKTLPNGIDIWTRFFGQNPYGALPLALYHVVQLLVDTLLLKRLEASNNAVTGQDREETPG